MDNDKLRAYAHLIAKKGINVVPGQEVVIRTAPVQLGFLEMLAEECYLAGAAKVTVDWRYEPLTKLAVKFESDAVLGTVEKWEEARLQHRVETLPAEIYLDSDDPDGLAGIDAEKWAKAQQKRFAVTRPYRDAMENRQQWCVAAVPGVEWAGKVFPGLSDEEAVEKLWAAILQCARVEDDPIAAWDTHDASLSARCAWLNSLHLRRLYYKSEKTGTDLTVGLLPQMLFCGAEEAVEIPSGSGQKVLFNANIPTEEVFTTPRKGDAEGIAVATKPLSYRGVLIEDFSVRFEHGRVTEVHAKKNEDALRLMVAMDEGASMLGECALVPFHSPIRNSGLLFYNTLFDENAACHLALGEGYSSCLKDALSYTPEQARALGVNDSMIHEDFMIGSDDLCITGETEEGEMVPIFVGGEWAN